MQRVAIVCSAGILSGKEVMSLELITGLRDKGYEVEVVTSSWGNGVFRRRVEELCFKTHMMRLGFISAILSPKNMYMTAHQLIYWPALLNRYRRFLKSFAPDKIIHTNWHHLLLLLPFVCPQRDLFWLHEVVPDKPQYKQVFNLLERRLDRFIAVSRAVASSLRTLGVPEEKIAVVHNGISVTPTERRSTPSSHHLVIGIVGQIGKWKGHEDLLRAFTEIAPEFPSAELHIVGRGAAEYEQHLRNQTVGLKITSRVVWRGFLKDRERIYEGMSVCVIPSLSADPLPTTAIEAGLFGIPVIASRGGGLPEIIQDGRNGFLIDAGNPSQIASRLRELLGDIVLRKEMGDWAREFATENFGRERFLRAFANVLLSI